jgi:hypothetical protein
MGKRGLVVLLAVLLAGCTRVVDSPRQRPAPPVAPITAGQAVDLLSEEAQQGDDGNLFVTVEPDECSGVAREVEPPFIFDGDPTAHEGGHWVADAGREVFIEELVGVYRANFNPREALAKVKHTIDSCRDDPLTVTAMDKDVLVFRLLPQTDTGSPDIVVWSFQANTWACDNAFVAAHNAAIEITACADTNGYDVLSLAQDAAKRIDALANTTA